MNNDDTTFKVPFVMNRRNDLKLGQLLLFYSVIFSFTQNMNSLHIVQMLTLKRCLMFILIILRFTCVSDHYLKVYH